jgi:hypothetical protein
MIAATTWSGWKIPDMGGISMSSHADRSGQPERRWSIRSPQAFVAGLTLVLLCVFALWLTSGLPQGTLRAMGPAMLPRWLAVGIGLCGLALIVASFARPGDGLERWSLRGPLFVLLAILAFAVTIRPFSIGPIAIPGLGLAVAGPLAIIIGGYATDEARPRELLILALTLTAFCMLLFGDLLNLPIPLFPQSLAGLFPDGWSQKAILRVTATILALVGVALLPVGRDRSRKDGATDVAGHSGGI